MIELNHLTYTYRRGFVAIDDVTAVVSPGIHLLLGENGAGKTTLLRLIAGLLIPTSGQCLVEGTDMISREPSALRKVFMLPDTMEIPTSTIRKFAEVHSRFYPTFSHDDFEENLKEFNLTGNETFNQLSLGLRHKTLLAYIIALRTDALLLDEPANGLDITSKKALRHILARCTSPEQTVIISTHTVSDLRELYDGILVLSHGHLLLAKPSWEISEKISCRATPIPPYEHLFMEQGAGLFHSIVVNDSGEPSDLNYGLLYSALMSPARDRLLEIINSESATTADTLHNA
ncbi:MAG: ABC transporter ATP-binding protein [Duncaniella sp.]|nr:ABC transporter ATP-binding protein [Duncaniella sp.]